MTKIHWTAIGAIATVLSVLIAILAWAPWEGSVAKGEPITSSTAPIESDAASGAEPNSNPPVAPPPTPTRSSGPAATNPEIFYLMNLDDDAVLRGFDKYGVTDGPNTIGGVEYANSVSYKFNNCSNCTQPFEFIVPQGYERLTGIFGLSDTSRHDDVIDGIVYVTIYDAAGNQLLPPQRIEYPEAVPVDVIISGQPRLTIEVSSGTNYEQVVFGDAALVR